MIMFQDFLLGTYHSPRGIDGEAVPAILYPFNLRCLLWVPSMVAWLLSHLVQGGV